jgi:hypothetical protein
MMVLVILSLVSAVVFGFLAQATETTTRSNLNEQAQRDALIAVRTITANLRGVSAISSTYPATATCPSGGSYASPYTGYQNCLKFTISRPATGAATCPKTEVTYGLVNNNLLVDRVEYDTACAVTRTTSALPLLTGVINTTSGTPLFTYYSRSDIDMLTSPFLNPTGAAAIRLNLKVQYKGQKTTPLNFSAVVALRNKR